MHSLLQLTIAKILMKKHIDVEKYAGLWGIPATKLHAVLQEMVQLGHPIDITGHRVSLRKNDPIIPQSDRFTHLHVPFTSSTQNILQAMQPRKHATLLVSTDFQLLGRGRHQRRWVSPYGHNILFSMLLPAETQHPLLSIIVGHTIKMWLKNNLHIPHLMMKWPNDIIANDLKLCGTLLEMHPNNTHLVLGIGLNVHSAPNTSPSLSKPTITLDELSSHRMKRTDILQGISNSILQTITDSDIMLALQKNIVEKYNNEDYFHNKYLTTLENNTKIYGIGRGISADGSYLIENDEGQFIPIRSSSIRIHTGNPL